jgi:hypothetical protein
MINIKLLAGVCQFLVRLQPHHWIWCHAGLFNFSRPGLPVLLLNSDSPIFSKFLWPGLNQLSPEKGTNSFNRIASKFYIMHGVCKIVVIVNILSYCACTGKGNIEFVDFVWCIGHLEKYMSIGMIPIFRLFIQQRPSGSCRMQTYRSLFSALLSISCTYSAAEASVDIVQCLR